MADDVTPAGRSPKRRPLRTFLWVLAVGLGLLVLLNIFFPEIDLSTEDRIALIRVEGVILDSHETVGELKKFSENPSVKAIVLRIDSPGGGVVPSQEIHDAVQRVRTKNNKAVIASMGSVAASGGYYIAAATDRIVANPGTLTGSIGVIMETANVEGLLQKIGVEGVVIKSGKYKDVGSPLRKMSEEERGLLQTVMDDVHKQFIEAVAAGRALEVTDVQALADGRIFTGRQAKEAKLVDELGDLPFSSRPMSWGSKESRKSSNRGGGSPFGSCSTRSCPACFPSWISIRASA
jgi:protease IV